MPIRTGGVTKTNFTGVVEDELGVLEAASLAGSFSESKVAFPRCLTEASLK